MGSKSLTDKVIKNFETSFLLTFKQWLYPPSCSVSLSVHGNESIFSTQANKLSRCIINVFKKTIQLLCWHAVNLIATEQVWSARSKTSTCYTIHRKFAFIFGIHHQLLLLLRACHASPPLGLRRWPFRWLHLPQSRPLRISEWCHNLRGQDHETEHSGN